jgi:hypothetical protein
MVVRSRRTKAEMLHEEDLIFQFIRDQGKVTVRQIYYCLVSHNIVPSSESSYNMVDRKVNEMRYEERIPFGSILDTTSFYGTLQWNSFGELLDYSKSIYRSNWNLEFDIYLEVWIEKEALASLVSEAADRYGVFTSASGGISKVSQVHSFLKRALRYNKTTTILYLGDFDPTGTHIDEVIGDQIDKQRPFFWNIPDILVRRIAVTEQQTIKLPENYQEANEKDPNYEEYVNRFGTKTWELEALSSRDLAIIVENVLAEYRPIPRIEELEERDRIEVEEQ